MEKGAKNRDSEVDYVKWLFELSNKDVAVAGGKGASLAEMFNNNFPVPPAFVVTAQAFGKFIEKIEPEINEIIKKTDVENTMQLNENSKKIRELIEMQELPRDMEEQIVESYETLGVEKNRVEKDPMKILEKSEQVFVAIRSSATTEDLADASFAGQQETFLNIKSSKKLLESIKKCFSSLYTPRAIYYRERKGFGNVKALLSVVIQKMINSEKSGVMFTKNPIREDGNVVIEAVFGL
ncbi:MAG: PEP/pyruvate-binding domain-containing protein, partial [bacterium]|nr:PEP/pyruvate-binding domain-containing protein [bacterium]